MTDINKLEFNPLQDEHSKLELLFTMPNYGTHHTYANSDTMSALDTMPVMTARVSIGGGLKTYQQDVKLLKYLWDNQHSSPFESVQLQFYVKCPIFVARQWMRHRTWSYNELSLRYTELDSKRYYIPNQFRMQSKTNMQGTGQNMPEHLQNACKRLTISSSDSSYVNYQELLGMGVEKGLARLILPVNFYTEFIGSVNLNNLLKFLSLRADEHAQFEIRQYAYAIEEILAFVCPEIYMLYKS